MSHYTVVWARLAQDQLAELWLAAQNRQWITAAADYIERSLRQDPYRGSTRSTESLFELVVAPLSVAFTISDDDRRVTVTGVTLVKPDEE